MEDIRSKTLKNGYFGQKWPNFDHFWPFWGSKKFSTEKFVGGHLSHMETQLHAKIRKKYLTVKAVGPEHTHALDYFIKKPKIQVKYAKLRRSHDHI